MLNIKKMLGNVYVIYIVRLSYIVQDGSLLV